MMCFAASSRIEVTCRAAGVPYASRVIRVLPSLLVETTTSSLPACVSAGACRGSGAADLYFTVSPSRTGSVGGLTNVNPFPDRETSRITG